MQIDSAFLNVQASGSIGSNVSGAGQPVWRNVLPSFQRDLNPAALNAAWAARLTVVGAVETYVINNFPNVEKNGDAILADDGLQLLMVQMTLLVVRVGKLNPLADSAGEVTVTITDTMGTLTRTLTEGDIVLDSAPAFLLLPTSAISIAFSTGTADNLCADVLLLGAGSEIPDS